MNPIRPILVSIFVVISLCFASSACQSPAPAPDAKQTQRPAQETSTPAQTTSQDQPDEQGPSITYHYRDGKTRAYLPLTSPLCQKDESAQPLYEIVALWRFDLEADRWTSVDVAPDVRYRIECNAMLDLNNFLGFDLDPGTYAVAAEVDGTLERHVFYNGEMSCNDVGADTAPEGEVALCIVGESSAQVHVVPDPAQLKL